MLLKALVLAAVAGTVAAHRPENVSICDFYTTALLNNNTAANQLTLLTLLVNTAVIGNYTTPNVGISVPGILTAGSYNNTEVNLLPYFTGDLASANRGGDSGVSVNFLDGGGAAPLKQNMPADSEDTNQHLLMTHLYEYFGTLLGCSMQGGAVFTPYDGDPSMYQTHKFMKLNAAEVGYFVTQVGLSAASFGVPEHDVTPVADALFALFGFRCSPPTVVIPAQGPHLQSVCTDAEGGCQLDPQAVCAQYQDVAEPGAISGNTTMTMTGAGGGAASGAASGAATSTGNATGARGTAVSTAAAEVVRAGMGIVAAAGGFAAMLL